MNTEFFDSASFGIALLFASSVLILLLSVGIVILNANCVALFLRPLVKYIISLALVVCLALFFLYHYMSEVPLREAELLLSRESSVIYIDGKKKDVREELLKAFKDRLYSKRSGSQPIRFKDFKILNGDKELTFRLGTDSYESDFLWVYFPKYKWHSSLCYLKLSEAYLNKVD